jgi:hypothetical protein
MIAESARRFHAWEISSSDVLTGLDKSGPV